LLLLFILAIIVPAVGNWYIGSSSGSTVQITGLYNLNLQQGQTITVNVTVSDVADMSSLRINLAWDPTVLTVTTGDQKGWIDSKTGTRYNIYEGPFLKSFANSTMFLINKVDNVAGNISAIFNTITSQGITASGSGVVVIIDFTCVNPATSTIRIIGPREGRSSLQSGTGEQIPHQDINGLVTNEGPPAIWSQFWFQATVGFTLIEIMILALFFLVVVRWWRSRAEATEEEEIDELFSS